jgi:hypothetical protein
MGLAPYGTIQVLWQVITLIFKAFKHVVFVKKLMHVGKFKNLQHTTNIPIHLTYIKITESETITERTQVYPGKPSWGRKPSQNFSLDSSTKYNTSTRL